MNYTILKNADQIATENSNSLTQSLTLWRLSELSSGFSGRTLRKIHFTALTFFPQLERGLNMDMFLEKLRMAVEKQNKERRELNNSTNTA